MIRMPRLAAAVLTGALAVGLMATTGGSASAAPGDRTGGWLESQLSGGLVHNDQYDIDDYGLTADTGIALAELGGHRTALRAVRKALGANVGAWTTGGEPGGVYAGSTAKAIAFAQAVGADPRSFGGTDLVVQLRGRVSTSAPTTGRISDKSTYGDYANTIGQAYAVGALSQAGSNRAGIATRFLLQQQCASGYFRLNFSAPTAKDQTCDGAAKADKARDTDATAIALIQLLSIEKPSANTRNAIAKAVRFLGLTQKSDGSFGGGPTTKAPNANSTGLAAWALGDAGRCDAAHRAARWAAKLQFHGAVAYDGAALAAAKKDGITVEARDQWRRASSQAAPGLRTLASCAS